MIEKKRVTLTDAERVLLKACLLEKQETLEAAGRGQHGEVFFAIRVSIDAISGILTKLEGEQK